MTIPAWLMAIALVVIAAAFAWMAFKPPQRFEFAGLGFGVTPSIDLSLEGAVIDFDRAALNGNDECPDGWTYFEPAIGRVILGAGATVKDGPPDNTRAFRPSLAENPSEAVGGTERHTLTVDEMPHHRHWYYSSTGPGDEHSKEEVGNYVFARSADPDAAHPAFALNRSIQGQCHNMTQYP
ncbi:MAG: hypothetical protein AAFX81_01910 [Pseudomonadota bacterium]